MQKHPLFTKENLAFKLEWRRCAVIHAFDLQIFNHSPRAKLCTNEVPIKDTAVNKVAKISALKELMFLERVNRRQTNERRRKQRKRSYGDECLFREIKMEQNNDKWESGFLILDEDAKCNPGSEWQEETSYTKTCEIRAFRREYKSPGVGTLNFRNFVSEWASNLVSHGNELPIWF